MYIDKVAELEEYELYPEQYIIKSKEYLEDLVLEGKTQNGYSFIDRLGEYYKFGRSFKNYEIAIVRLPKYLGSSLINALDKEYGNNYEIYLYYKDSNCNFSEGYHLRKDDKYIHKVAYIDPESEIER